MAKCNFSINFIESTEALVLKANAAIKEANGSFNGDARTGSFGLSTPLGSVSGSYEIENSSIIIEIIEKPIFLSCSKIQSELQKYLAA